MPFFEVLFQSAWGILLVLIFFNGSIAVHELGHYLAARWRGLKVERFSLFGLGPKLISWHGKDGVEYCICAIPFGAYVALPQLAEMRALEGEAEIEKTDSLPPISYTDKMIVAFAGPFFNLILAVLVALVGWWTGYPSYTGGESARIGYVYETLENDVAGPAFAAGVQPGDIIVAIDGKPVDSFKQVPELVALGIGRDAQGNPKTTFTLDRDGQVFDVTINPVLRVINEASGDKMRTIGIQSTDPMTVGAVAKNSPAARAGLQAGDEIISINGQKVFSIAQIASILDENRNQEVRLEVIRDGQTRILTPTATPVPETKPLARIFLPEIEEAAFEIIPHYREDFAGDPAEPSAPSQLAVYALDPGRSLMVASGDWEIRSLDGETIDSMAALWKRFDTSSDTRPTTLTLINDRGDVRNRTLPEGTRLERVAPQERVMLGFGPRADAILVHQNPIEQFQEHLDRTFRTLGSLISRDSDIGIRHLSGPVGITTNLYRVAQLDWRMALWFAVLLNINLAVLNLLPIPVLDGGHMMFATISKLWGKPLPVNFIASVQGAFMFLLLGVMFYVLFYDSMREVGYHEQRQDLKREASQTIPIEFRPDRYQ